MNVETDEITSEVSNAQAMADVLAGMPAPASLEKLADFYKVMGDPNRLRLLIALQKTEFCASDLAELAGMTRSAASHQLKALKNAKLVKTRREGKTVFYSLDDDHISSVLNVAFEHIMEDPE